jgi:hypothetical protein
MQSFSPSPIPAVVERQMANLTLDDFKRTLSAGSPPENISPALRALWHDAQGNWELAHDTAQSADGEAGAWVHAYLHRKEGDAANAAYWYRRAQKPVATGALTTEWDHIASALLA